MVVVTEPESDQLPPPPPPPRAAPLMMAWVLTPPEAWPATEALTFAEAEDDDDAPLEATTCKLGRLTVTFWPPPSPFEPFP
jgi:hypothetical protein